MLTKLLAAVQNRPYIKAIGIILLLAVIILVGSAYWARKNIGMIFSEVAAKQMVIKGQLTVESITADWDGCVFFENLVWIDNSGKTAAQIPYGSFKVNFWDIITRRITPASIKMIDLRGAKIAITFNERMAIKSIDRRKSPAVKQPKNDQMNVKLDKYDINARLMLTDCTLEAFFENRHFLLYDVNADLNINTKKAISGYFTSGFFGGTISADGLAISGDIDLTKPIQEYNLDLEFKEVNPSTLGAGIGIYEPVSALAKMTGQLPNPSIKGTLSMKDLVLPGLHFTDLKGKFDYQNGVIAATEVKAKAFNGDVVASGYFNIDNKTYLIDMVGKMLQAQRAAGKDIACLVDLTARMQGFGDPKSVLTIGSFKSSYGVYKGIPFKSISADVRNQYGVLEFNNIIAKTLMGSFTTSLTLTKGKVHVGPIQSYKKR